MRRVYAWMCARIRRDVTQYVARLFTVAGTQCVCTRGRFRTSGVRRNCFVDRTFVAQIGLSARFFRRLNCRKTTKPVELSVARCNLTLCQAQLFSQFFLESKIGPNLCRIRTCTAFTGEKNNSVKFRKLREKTRARQQSLRLI